MWREGTIVLLGTLLQLFCCTVKLHSPLWCWKQFKENCFSTYSRNFMRICIVSLEENSVLSWGAVKLLPISNSVKACSLFITTVQLRFGKGEVIFHYTWKLIIAMAVLGERGRRCGRVKPILCMSAGFQSLLWSVHFKGGSSSSMLSLDGFCLLM